MDEVERRTGHNYDHNDIKQKCLVERNALKFADFAKGKNFQCRQRAGHQGDRDKGSDEFVN